MTCPACGAFEPQTEFIPGVGMRDAETGYLDDECQYRCLECGEASPADDWRDVPQGAVVKNEFSNRESKLVELDRR